MLTVIEIMNAKPPSWDEVSAKMGPGYTNEACRYVSLQSIIAMGILLLLFHSTAYITVGISLVIRQTFMSGSAALLHSNLWPPLLSSYLWAFPAAFSVGSHLLQSAFPEAQARFFQD